MNLSILVDFAGHVVLVERYRRQLLKATGMANGLR